MIDLDLYSSSKSLTNEIQGNSALILGYGREGRSAARYLNKHFPQLRLAIADRQAVGLEPSIKNAEIFTGDEYLSRISDFNTIIRSPGIPPHLPELTEARKNGCWITSLTNLFMSLAPGKVIAITGTKGKSTTSSLIAHLLRNSNNDVRLLGNIGLPALEGLEESNSETVFILELSSFQLEDLRYAPHTAVLLNIVPEHLDYHQTFAEYCRAKSNITSSQTNAQNLISSPSYESTREIIARSKAKRFFFSIQPEDSSVAFVIDQEITLRSVNGHKQGIVALNQLPIIGPGNVQNALAAITTASSLGVSAEEIRAKLLTFTPLPHRLEKIGTYRGITFINDSLSTIPEAAINALEALGSDVHTLICGGHDRGLDYRGLGEVLVRSQIQQLILFPSTGAKILSSCELADHNYRSKFQVYNTDDMRRAIEIAYQTTPSDKICLMSPASSSLNLFRDYQERGDLFRRYVEELE